ncbi:MAG: PCMD domain-containing protein [Bacteroidales bacterium]|nr:PCMD domain-containing protein [Bacteroidales bacterium]
MRRVDLLLFCAFIGHWVTFSAGAQERTVRLINEVGKFDNWCVREIKESAVIGGNTEYLYEFYGRPTDTLRTGKQPFKAPEGYLWRTNNVLAVVMGVVKTNNTVYPERRGEGYCARIETHIEEVKALGVVNMDVVCQGALIVGELPEPITTTRDPMTKVEYAIPFTGSPKYLQLDYKADVGYETVRGTGFSKLKPMGEPDYAEITMILQKRWEDEEGNVHALRVGTGIERIMEDIPQWINGHKVNIYYGNMTAEPSYKEYMGLKNDPETAYHTLNSKGQDVMVLEEGWAPASTQPTHLVLHFISSCGKAFYGGVGNVLWVDNVEIVM